MNRITWRNRRNRERAFRKKMIPIVWSWYSVNLGASDDHVDALRWPPRPITNFGTKFVVSALDSNNPEKVSAAKILTEVANSL